MKRIIALVLSLLLCVSLCACAGATDNLIGDTASGTVYTVGLCNYVEDASLLQIENAIREQLDSIGKQKGVAFKLMCDNANADANVMSQIVANFVTEKVDLMIGIATPVALCMQSAAEGTGIPVIYSAVSDPEGSKLCDKDGLSHANITGTSDFLNTVALLDLILAANPDLKTLALLYDNGQEASSTPVKTAKAYLSSKGLSFREYTGTNNTEVEQAVSQIIADGADAVFTPTDNTIMTAELSIYEKLCEAKIPHYAGANSFALNGALLGYGVDYVQLGKSTADMVAEVLIDGKDAGEMPVVTFDNGTATVNTEICEKLGYDLEGFKHAISPYCTNIETLVTAEKFN